MPEAYAAVLGGLNLDLAGLAGSSFRLHDSNPGEITLSVGGVAHNIAANLTALKVRVSLLCAYSDDVFGQLLKNACLSRGISLDHALFLPGMRSCSYLYLTDSSGEMLAGINDMSLMDRLGPGEIQKHRAFLAGAAALCVDANLPAETLLSAAACKGGPLFADAVSCGKAPRLLPILPFIDVLKINREEASVLTGLPVRTKEEAFRAAALLRDRGVSRVFLSMGKDGICALGKGGPIHLPAPKTRIVSVNGAGDSMMAALIWAFLSGGESLSLEKACQIAQAAACITLESAESVSPHLTPGEIRRRLS